MMVLGEQFLDPFRAGADDFEHSTPSSVDVGQDGHHDLFGFERCDEESFAGVVAGWVSPSAFVDERYSLPEFPEVSFGAHAGLFDGDNDGRHGLRVRLCVRADQSQGAGADADMRPIPHSGPGSRLRPFARPLKGAQQ
jgi:hypothetical protein